MEHLDTVQAKDDSTIFGSNYHVGFPDLSFLLNCSFTVIFVHLGVIEMETRHCGLSKVFCSHKSQLRLVINYLLNILKCITIFAK